MRALTNLDPKLSTEVRTYSFDFANQLDILGGETISTKALAISVYSGAADASAAAMLSGALGTSGQTVITAHIQNGIAGNIYQLLCTITTSLSNTYSQAGFLAVLSALL